jgi:NAD dependent epimerase/dehydratase family enzyme
MGHRPTSDNDKLNLENVKSIHWDPSSSSYTDRPSLNDNNKEMDAVVNLTGENIFGGWTSEKKKRISDSRVNTTKTIRILPNTVQGQD